MKNEQQTKTTNGHADKLSKKEQEENENKQKE